MAVVARVFIVAALREIESRNQRVCFLWRQTLLVFGSVVQGG